MVVVIQQVQAFAVVLDDIQHLAGIQPVFHAAHQLHHLAQLLQPLLVHHIAANQVLAQPLRSPDAELGTTPGVHAVAHGKNHVQVVEIDRAAHCAGAFLSNL